MGLLDIHGVDLERIAIGDPLATRDAIALIVAKLEEEALIRARDISRRGPQPEQDWLSLAMTLRGPRDTGLVSSHRLQTRTIRIYRVTSAQAITTGTVTKVQFNAATLDNYSEADVVTNYRITPQSEGIWLFVSQIVVTSLNGRLDVILRKNGSTEISQSLYVSAGDDVGGPAIDIATMNGSTDYIEAFVQHDHGTDRNVVSGTHNTFLIAHHLGLAN